MSIRSLIGSAVLVASLIISAQSQSFEREQYVLPVNGPQGDLNRDGYPDFIVGIDSTHFGVLLSNGANGYQALQSYVGGGVLVLEDFNRDGNEDVIAGNFFYAGHADGSLSTGEQILQGDITAAVTADFNRDGTLDLAYVTSSVDPSQSYFEHIALVALGRGDGSFNPPKAIGSMFSQGFGGDQVLTGDFDGDGKGDIAWNLIDGDRGGVSDTFAAIYGDGSGGFAWHYEQASGAYHFSLADENRDGRSDLIGVNTGDGWGDVGSSVEVWRGSASRTFSRVVLPALDWYPDQAVGADFDGDGKTELAAIGQAASSSCCDSAKVVRIFHQDPSGTYILSQTLQFESMLTNITLGDFNRDQRPDIAISEQFRDVLDVLKNTTVGNFPSCQAPIRYGINVCSPTASSTSPIRFNIAASSFSPLRKLEIWVDGAKKAETFNSWSTYSFADKSLSLASGTHNVSVYAGTYDNRLQKKSFTVSVGGNVCAQPATVTATVICSPPNGATVSSPVSVQAKGGGSVTFMEVWVDGSKRFQTSGNSVSTSLALAAGSHRLSVYSKNGTGVLSNAVSTFTVK